MIGVSPAYFICRYGDRFSPEHVISGLKDLAQLGYQALQLEVYHADSITLWTSSGFARIISAAGGNNLVVSQCVAHLLLHAFADEATLFSPWGVAEAAAISAALPPDRCPVLTIPVPAFDVSAAPVANAGAWRRIEDRFEEKLSAMVSEIEQRGLRVALEVMPGSLVGGIQGFLRLCERLENRGHDKLGFNLDTGHAWASREPLGLSITRLQGRILGTHLCDNWASENLSLAPGSAGIDWPPLLSTLSSAGYSGSFDIEIHCPADQVLDQYASARLFLADISAQNQIKEPA